MLFSLSDNGQDNDVQKGAHGHGSTSICHDYAPPLLQCSTGSTASLSHRREAPLARLTPRYFLTHDLTQYMLDMLQVLF